MLIKSYCVVLPFILLVSVPFESYFITYSNQDLRFSGSVESFNAKSIIDQNNLVGNTSNIYIEANNIILEMNNPDIIFWSIKNITIENYKGEKKITNSSPYIQVKNYKNKYLVFSNGSLGFIFKNFTIIKTSEAFYDSVFINGTTVNNQVFSNGGKVSMDDNSVDSIIVGGEKITNFKQIVFEIDKSSDIRFSSEISEPNAYPLEISAYPISNLRIEGFFSRLTLNKGEGTLRLRNHQFDIKAADDLSIETLPYTSKLSVNDKIVNFKGIASYSFLNNNDAIMSDFTYWYQFKPEIISAIGALIAAVGALIAAIFSAISAFFSFRSKNNKKIQEEMERI